MGVQGSSGKARPLGKIITYLFCFTVDDVVLVTSVYYRLPEGLQDKPDGLCYSQALFQGGFWVNYK